MFLFLKYGQYLVDDNKGERLESIDEICGNVGVNQGKNYSGLCPCILQ